MKTSAPLLLIATLLAGCAPQAITGYTTVTVRELKTAYDAGAYVLDVRTPAEYAEGHLARAVNLPLDQVQARAGEVPADRPVYVICRSGNRSAQASAILTMAGKDVRNVGGGMNDWIAAGYPVTR
ncbi:rhodanese-related sulfurtransferase [Deinococcus metalli]|uniref:Sulfurtransferase n=1 Tax=Deinococcus metalli TaxID=1141878 RepID=A0A7W8NSJ7_9DEIO|nr:rhodanese-like domain-containing protein [Deinococcus metalli]MBB5379025.1 rhodanese-related sulfurtransferase [Deinococcus metalli]GHF63260.1 sulfurtransferase [Deinococcus metalli]